MSIQRKKKPVEFHFVDMNDPERYKKLKVARACDFCRRRKSKCDIGVPGSGTCSNCQKYKMVCIFSPVTTRTELTPRPDDPLLTPQFSLTLMEHLQFRFPLLLIREGQVGYEKSPPPQQEEMTESSLELPLTNEPSMQLETTLFNIYFNCFHSAFPILLKQSILHIHSQDRMLLSRALRFAIMALACHFYFVASPVPDMNDVSFSNSHKIIQHFYHIARNEINLLIRASSSPTSTSSSPPRLDTVQTLIMLYKHHEILGTDGIHYLETAQNLIGQLQSMIPQQQEMINRTRWILFGLIGLSNLSDTRFNRMYAQINLPTDLPQALQEEIDEDDEHVTAYQHINRFAQLSNLSVLYSHTVQSLIKGATSQLICFEQFKEIRQHWHDSLHPVTQNRLISLSAADTENMDILILYTAILYDMLYLLLVLHHHVSELEWDSVETAYRLHRMVHTWISKPSYISAIQSRRMAAFALMLCLQVQFIREEDKIDTDMIDQIRQTIALTKIDPRLDGELKELYIALTNKISSGYLSQQGVDYFSLRPHTVMHSTESSQDHPPSSTPGLWDILSTTTNGGLTTPIREDTHSHHQTSEWITAQQRQQQQQLHVYQLTVAPPIPSTSTPNISTEDDTNKDYFTLERLNQMTL